MMCAKKKKQGTKNLVPASIGLPGVPMFLFVTIAVSATLVLLFLFPPEAHRTAARRFTGYGEGGTATKSPVRIYGGLVLLLVSSASASVWRHFFYLLGEHQSLLGQERHDARMM